MEELLGGIIVYRKWCGRRSNFGNFEVACSDACFHQLCAWVVDCQATSTVFLDCQGIALSSHATVGGGKGILEQFFMKAATIQKYFERACYR